VSGLGIGAQTASPVAKENLPVRTRRRISVLVAALLGALLLLPVAAQAADFGFEAAWVKTTGADGTLSRQAGGHFDLQTHLQFKYDHSTSTLSGNPKDIRADLPPGVIGNPNAVPKCPVALLRVPNQPNTPHCSGDSQVGFAFITDTPGVLTQVPVFNMEHPPDVPGMLGFTYLDVPIFIQPQVRPGDYGISALSARTSQAHPIFGAEVIIWGVPSDSSHDAQRWRRFPYPEFPEFEEPGYGAPSQAPKLPFLTNATSCPGSPSPYSVSANSWQNPDVFDVKSLAADFDGTPFITDNCEQLKFQPSLAAQFGSRQAASPSSLNVDIKVPQNEDPKGLATAHVRKTTLTLPEGFSINASSAKGLGSCAPDQIKLGSNEAPTCPDSSKIGAVSIRTALLEEELQGNVILAKQNDNPFGSLLALYIVAKGPGFYLKLPGKVEADPSTGRLTTTFSDTPQLPFDELQVSLNAGPHAALQTPSACGVYSVHAEMTSWASPVPVTLDVPVTIDQGCATGGFDPGLKAGAVSSLAGKFSPFTLQVTRDDGEQNLSRIEATLPPGELAKLAGVPLCPDSAAATASCPAASQVGTTTVGAGAGTDPVYVPEAGKAPTAVYLAGPYKGAPYSLVVKVPAQAGPFDLGTVTVRNALFVDPVTTQVTAKSDSLPQILQGIPISYRDVRVEVNRPEFSLNPTSCDPMKVISTLTSSAGKTASPSARFQAAGCGELAFAPKLAIKVKGPARRGAYQQLTATLTQAKGQANIGKVSVALPHSEFLAQNHIKTICTRVQFAAEQCPAGSIYGKARAFSPLLDRTLEGPVYLRSSSNPLPDLVVALHGQIDVDLAGRIDSVNGGIRTTFGAVPDAPVSKFVLEMKGGKKSLLVNSRNLCATTNKATVKIDGQNGKTADQSPTVTNSCGKKSTGHRRTR
jgi:hypothetical protein